MEIGAFIFDVDGVLTDTVELHYRSWVKLGQEEGIPFSREMNDRIRGLTRPESLKVFLAGREVTESQAQDYLHRKNEYFLAELEQLSPQDMLPGVLPLLKQIKAAGIPIAVGSASRNAREVVRRLGIDGYMDAYADGHSVQRSKPAPDVFLAAARLLGKPPTECVVVEDSEAGITAAHAAGMAAIGVGPSAQNAGADVWCLTLEGVSLGDIRQVLRAARRLSSEKL